MLPYGGVLRPSLQHGNCAQTFGVLGQQHAAIFGQAKNATRFFVQQTDGCHGAEETVSGFCMQFQLGGKKRSATWSFLQRFNNTELHPRIHDLCAPCSEDQFVDAILSIAVHRAPPKNGKDSAAKLSVYPEV